MIGAASPVAAATSIDTNGTVLISNQGTNDLALRGGTLEIDKSGSYTNTITLENSDTSTITSTVDLHGNIATLSGVISNDTTGSYPGTLAITDSVGNGTLTLTGTSTYTGPTTIASGATLVMSGTGSIASSSGLTNNGVLDISQASTVATLTSLSGAGSVVLGSQSLNISNSSGTFTGVISGSGGLIINGGTQVLDNTQTYTGGTTIARGTLQIGAADSAGSILGNVAVAGTLAFDRVDDIVFNGLISGTGGVSQLGSGSLTLTQVETYSGTTTVSAGTFILAPGASIVNSSVATDGTFDISATSGTTVKSLSGTGTVQLGSANLTLTAGAGTFTGIIAGSGGIILTSGTEILTGANTYTGPTIVNGGTLEVGAATVTNNVTNYGTFGYYSTGAVAMSGVVSGSGGVIQAGTGTTTLTAQQLYTGATTISAGTLALSGSASIASSSNVIVNGTLSISGVSSGASITTLSGVGTVQMGNEDLTLTSASGTFTGGISGSGNFILAAGKETLSGSSTFTGVATINPGTTLSLGGASVLPTASKIVDNGTLDISPVTANGLQSTTVTTSLTGSGTVTLGTATLILSNAADTFAGTITGAGGLTITGGSEILTGSNTYTGVTSIKGGSLLLSGSGSIASTGTVSDSGIFDISAVSGGAVALGSLSGTGSVTLGNTVLTLSAAADTFSGSIAGAGGLVVAGGTETLAGANSYSGNTTVAGTLQLGNGVTVGSVVGSIADNGTLIFNEPSTTVVANAISGTGSVVQTGPGTVALTGANSYTGGTSITGGTLQIGNGGTAGSLTGNIADNGTLAFDRSDAIVFAGTISGTGAVSQIGSGNVTLVTANGYTGVTSISSASLLSLSGAGSIANSSSVIDNGALDISASTGPVKLISLTGTGSIQLGSQSVEITGGADTFSGNISGSGGLTLDAGSETLSGTNTYTGATRISGGVLSVTGSIASSSGVTVNAGGTLGGSGSVPSVVANSGATVSPASGTLKVSGDVTFANGSTYAVNFASSSQSSLSASGSATIAGTLSVSSSDGTYLLGQKVAVLSANNGVSGQFTSAPITTSGAKLAGKLSQDQNNIYLEVDLSQLSPLLPASATGNQTSVVRGIDNAIAAGDTLSSGINNLANLTSSTLGPAADQMDGEVGADLAQVADNSLKPFITAISNHLAGTGSSKADNSKKGTIWSAALLDGNVIGADTPEIGSHKLDTSASSVVVGGDWSISRRLRMGVAASVSHMSFDAGNSLGHGSDEAIQLAAYSYAQLGAHLYGSLIGAASFDSVSTNRKLSALDNEILTGNVNLANFSVRYETGLKASWIAPYIAVEGDIHSNPGYSETSSVSSSPFALSYNSQTDADAQFELGGRQKANILLGRNWRLELTDRVAWHYNSMSRSQITAQFSSLPESQFLTYGATADKNTALMSLGARLTNNRGLNLSLNMDSSASQHSQSYMGSFGLGVAW